MAACDGRCLLLVALGSSGAACLLLAAALLIAACWCARRLDAASRIHASNTEVAAIVLNVAFW